jgi:hypothetical protein
MGSDRSASVSTTATEQNHNTRQGTKACPPIEQVPRPSVAWLKGLEKAEAAKEEQSDEYQSSDHSNYDSRELPNLSHSQV